MAPHGVGVVDAQLELQFNEPVKAEFSTVAVIGPGGAQRQVGQAVVQGAVLTVPVRSGGPPGMYTISYRVVSADGHPVTGVVRVTLAPPATSTATSTPSQSLRPARHRCRSPDQAAPVRVADERPVAPWLLGGQRRAIKPG